MANNVIALTKDNFENEVIKCTTPVLVDFWAVWCGPCRAVAPIVESLANDYAEKVKVCKLNVDEQGELSARFKVMSIPTLILFKNGQIVEKIIGLRSKEDFVVMLNKHI